MNDRRRIVGLLVTAGAALAMGLQVYNAANEASGGVLEARLRAAWGRLWGPIARQRRIEQTVAREAGAVVWEAMEALDNEHD